MTKDSVTLIQRLIDATKAKTYLEVGVEKGATFFEIKAEKKFAVDPHFRFDPSDRESETERYFQMTSDDFWNSINPQLMFDVVFLDGLHTFEQTYRDFCAVLAHTTSSSVIIIDDIFPTDVFSSLTDHGNAIRFREMHGIDSRAWHGDVYKVILAINDFHPTLDFRTIVGGENLQTVVWRSGDVFRSPRFNSLELISRCSWFELKDNEDIMRPCLEDDLFPILSILSN
ncbi:MAG: class I SAM-dependent methyltransferase [Gammaproteobacteria bacterium]